MRALSKGKKDRGKSKGQARCRHRVMSSRERTPPRFSVTLSRMSAINRRKFVTQCGGAAAGAWLLPKMARGAASGPSVNFPTAPRDRVAVAAYPFREFIVGWKGWDGTSPGSVPAAHRLQPHAFAAPV